MSVLSQIKSNNKGNGKNEWTQEEVRLTFGMKFLGFTRPQIEEVLGYDGVDKNGKPKPIHSANSITYLGRKFKSDEALEKFTGFTKAEEYIEFATNYLNQSVEAHDENEAS